MKITFDEQYPNAEVGDVVLTEPHIVTKTEYSHNCIVCGTVTSFSDDNEGNNFVCSHECVNRIEASYDTMYSKEDQKESPESDEVTEKGKRLIEENKEALQRLADWDVPSN